MYYYIVNIRLSFYSIKFTYRLNLYLEMKKVLDR